MSANNQNPNLFRLSLPEWLKEQVGSGIHKGVFWIDEEEKIFHVPWKHASRNGWEDGDVSLFKAWAIYTNRYREGIDKPKPALWKTNFRCAINSHNYITFVKDQGQRRGDQAHRIMKIIEQTNCKPQLEETSKTFEPLRKRVRVTYPSSSDQSRKRTVHFTKSRSKIDPCDYCRNENSESCANCSFKLNNDNNFFHSNGGFIRENGTSGNVLRKKETLIKPKLAGRKPNLQDLYFVGKALQFDDTGIGFNISTYLTDQTSGLISAIKNVKQEIDDDDDSRLVVQSTQIPDMGMNDHISDHSSDVDDAQINTSKEDGDDELIMPREYPSI